MSDLIQVFECPDPKCRGRVLKQCVHVPCCRTVASFDVFGEPECCDDAYTSDDDLGHCMNENYDDSLTSPDYFYCACCGKYWYSVNQGEESLVATGALKTIPQAQYSKWLETEFEQDYTYTWEIRESLSKHDLLFVFYKNNVVCGMCRTVCYDLAGAWWYQLRDLYPNPEVFMWEEDCELEDPEEWDEYLNDTYGPCNAVVIARNGNYDESVATPWSADVFWEYTKELVRHRPGWFVDTVPAWAICYLVNGDTDNLDETELALAKDYDKKHEVTSVSPESSTELCSWTNQISDCYEVVGYIKNNNNEQQENEKKDTES